MWNVGSGIWDVECGMCVSVCEYVCKHGTCWFRLLILVVLVLVLLLVLLLLLLDLLLTN